MMKPLTIFFLFLILTSCRSKVEQKQPERFYYMDNCKRDTAFIDKPSFDTTGLTFITEKNFDDPIGANRFYGSVIKLKNIPAPIDGDRKSTRLNSSHGYI